MEKIIIAFVLLISFTGIQRTDAQRVIEEGYIKIEVTKVYSESEQMQAMSGLLKGSTTEIYFTPAKSYSKANMMGGMSVIQTVSDYEKKENLMLMSMMGQKIKIKMSGDEIKEFESANMDLNDIEYKHFRDDTRDIVGFKCHRVEMKMKSNQRIGMTFWVTEEISTKAQVTTGIQTENVGGFPLEYVISVGGQLEMTMTATKFEKDFDKNIFNVDATGYSEMTMKEYMETMSQMGGGF